MKPGIAKLMTFLLDAHIRSFRSNTMHVLYAFFTYVFHVIYLITHQSMLL